MTLFLRLSLHILFLVRLTLRSIKDGITLLAISICFCLSLSPGLGQRHRVRLRSYVTPRGGE
jgi:hypothetical protein